MPTFEIIKPTPYFYLSSSRILVHWRLSQTLKMLLKQHAGEFQGESLNHFQKYSKTFTTYSITLPLVVLHIYMQLNTFIMEILCHIDN